MKQRNYLLIIIFVGVTAAMSIFSCQKERVWDNPYDPDVPPDIWMPKNLQLQQATTGIALTWQQEETRIDGFLIERKTGSSNWQQHHTLEDSEARQWTDTASVPPGEQVYYRLAAFAMANTSATVEDNILTLFAITGADPEPGATTARCGIRAGGQGLTEHGIVYSASPEPAETGTRLKATGDTLYLTNLTDSTTYYYTAYAFNGDVTVYGQTHSFTTKDIVLATPQTGEIQDISYHSATCTGNVTDNGGATVTERGVCWSTNPSPDINDNTVQAGSGTGAFSADITGLEPATTYYVRAYATNSEGIGYGDTESFTTGSQPDLLTDYDGNEYDIVTIGDQVWMAENLATTHYNDGTAIPNVTSNSTWSNLSTPAYCWYDNDEATYKPKYGALYNWYVVETGKVCPTGWHVPTDDEWTQLEEYLIANGYNYDGSTSGNKIAKSLAATSGWSSSSETGAIGNDMSSNNSTGFTALPSGSRSGKYGSFKDSGDNGYWYSSTENNSSYVWSCYLRYNLEYLGRDGGSNKRSGGPIRCLKD